ncbi:MAG: MGDG synthase family glycosyltransferase [Acidobacteriota bacterium]
MSDYRILLVAEPFGAGHIHAANNVADALKRLQPDAQVTVINNSAEQSGKKSGFSSHFYLGVLERLPGLYGSLYRQFDKPGGANMLFRAAYAIGPVDLKNEIESFNPQMVIATHPLPLPTLRALRKNSGHAFALGAVITDFICHGSWLYPDLELYFVASEQLRDYIMIWGVSADRIAVTGVPISARFEQPIDRTAARQKMSLDMNTPVILIMGGGLGMGPMSDLLLGLNSIEKYVQLVFVTGNNAELKESLDGMISQSKHKVNVYGFTKEIPALMAAADVLVSKPGGLTCSEAIACRLPLIINEPIPGQEEDNARFLEQAGVAVMTRNVSEVLAALKRIFGASETKMFDQLAMARLSHPDSSALIASRIIEFIDQNR